MLDKFKGTLFYNSESLLKSLPDTNRVGYSGRQSTASELLDNPKNNNVVTLFEKQALKTPSAIALICNQYKLTYRELNERSNQVAHYLRKRGVKAETLVPICIERGIEMIVGILGILKAGGAYVPIDPEYPQDRINYMLKDTGEKLIVSSAASRAKLLINGITVIEVDGDSELIQKEITANVCVKRNPDDLAYVIYTSGSTGKPKGVMVEHKSLLNYILVFKNYFSISAKDKVIQQFSISFDTMCEELYPALISGASVFIIKDGGKDIDTIKSYIESGGITIISTTPTVISWLNRELSHGYSLRYIISGGEVLSPSDVDKLYPAVPVVNGYGPTEATIGVTYNYIDSIANASLIGKPINNTQIYILNDKRELNPAGIIGEIYIGGIQVARGYLNQPELTSTKFFADPFSKQTGVRLYSTGDLGRYLPNGNLEYLGRIDEQVKVRGYRIELGEIENVLRQSGFVSQAIVIAKEDNNGNKRLVSYVVPKQPGTFDREAAILYLKSKLPEYMVPLLWVLLDRIPLTPNGKTDRKHLPEPDMGVVTSLYSAPQNETEAKLAEMWQTLLSIDRVGINDNFFELGGHSLLAMRVISAVRNQLGAELAVNEVFKYPTIAGLSAHLALNGRAALLPVIAPANPRPHLIPLSFSQERLWFIDKLEGSIQYHIPLVYKINGPLDREVLKKALQVIVNRHESLRTVILEDANGDVYQHLLAGSGWALGYTEAPAYKDDIEGLTAYVQELINNPFDLRTDYMLRAKLVGLGNEEHILVMTLHHIAWDGWSISVLVNELIEIYSAHIAVRIANLPLLPVQYSDYSLWQRKYLQGSLLEKKVAYWKKKLDGVAPLELPTDYTRPLVKSSQGATASFIISQNLSGQLQKLSRNHEATLYMTLLTAFKVLLYRYSGQEDICVGTPVAGRQHREVEGLIGFFVNTLALRSQITGDLSFKELLAVVKDTMLEAYDYQDAPFEKVVEAAVKERDINRNPLFQVMFVFMNTPEVPELRFGGLNLTEERFFNESTKFDLSFNLNETPKGIEGTINYSTDLYSEATIARMAGHYLNLLSSIANSVTEQIGCLKMLSDNEECQLSEEFNYTNSDQLLEDSIVDLFKQQVQTTPNATALKFGQVTQNYRELNERSNQLAHYLQNRGVKAESLVPICVERGIEMIVGILGILKAGGAYVPIDPEYPNERIKLMLADIQADVILTSEKYSFKTKEIVDEDKIFALDSHWHLLQSYPLTDPGTIIQANHLAYVLYTSGSTGKPKGVLVQHKSLAHALFAFNKINNINNTDSTLLTSSFSFDGSLTSIWPVLLKGGTLHIPTYAQFNPDWVLEYLSTNAITYFKTLPAIFKSIVSTDKFKDKNFCKSLRLVILGGERLNPDDIKKYIDFYPDVTVANQYGPTECTIINSIHTINKNNIRDFCKQPVIGKPIDNITINILDKNNQLCPIGVPGEISIGGIGLARGYLNSPELTNEKFITNPFSKKPNAKLYKSGDFGRWLSDGNIEYLGRQDDQVKIRGYRIELGEIESVLHNSGLVKQGVVLAKDDHQGARRLIGYAIPTLAGAFDKEELIKHLQARLPEYMLPMLWVELEKLPLTANGKIDRKALPDPEYGDMLAKAHVAPRNKTEEMLVGIWQELLGIERVGIDDNFFELGGHSLLATRVVSAIRKQLDAEVAIKAIFTNPTIALLTAHIEHNGGAALLPLITAAIPRPQHIPLSFSQERLWFIDQLEGSKHYHRPVVIQLNGHLKIEALENTLKTIVKRHEVLRTVFYEDEEGGVYQHIMPADCWNLNYTKSLLNYYSNDGLTAYIEELINHPFNLKADPMLRADLIGLKNEEYILVLTLHHIASDGWSSSILINEIITLYAAYAANSKPDLPSLPVQYADFAIWQRQYLRGDVLQKKASYWQAKLKGLTPLHLPTDNIRPVVQSKKGAIVDFSIAKSLAVKLQELSRENEVTLYMTLLSAFNILLYQYSGEEDICVGTPVAGRQQHETEGLIGFFINTLAIRSSVSGESSFAELVKEIKTTTLEAYEHQEIPFEKVVDAVVKERDMSRNPLFQVMFILQNTPAVPELQLGELELFPKDHVHATSLFDLSLFIKETADGLQGTIEYSTDLYNEATVNRMAEHYHQLLVSIIATPKKEIGKLQLLTANEEERFLYKRQANATQHLAAESIIDIFEKQVKKTPDAIALIFEKEKLSYDTLNKRANQLAHYLQKQGVRPETLIPICIERSAEMIIGILGVLKAGGAYVPIDPEYPEDRIRYMLEDTGAGMILSSETSLEKLKGSCASVIKLDTDWHLINLESTVNTGIQLSLHQLAYIIYTSGSTGKPKGVMVEHGTVIASTLCRNEYYQHMQTEFLVPSYAFDSSVAVIFGRFFAGGTLILCKDQLVKDIDNIKHRLKYCDSILCVPSYYKFLLNEGLLVNSKISRVILAGESLTKDLVELHYNKTANVSLYNEYGPTENTVWATVTKIKSAEDVISIGKPINNVQVYILNKQHNAVPIGAPGELYIGGVQLARGYLNQPGLTAKTFLNNPFNNDTNSRLYKTGDFGRWLTDGNIEFLGRADDQVKIRGYRIELGEIDNTLRQCPLIDQALVVAKKNNNGDDHLVGYVVSKGAYNKDAIQSYLGTKLPEYMVPALWVELQKMPLTPNGKIDKKALPNPDSSKIAAHKYVAPGSKIEKALAAIWQTLLKIDSVGIYNNFFELGGNSLLAMRLVPAIRRELKTEINIKDIFINPTIAGLAKYLESNSTTIYRSLVPIKATGNKPPLYIVCGVGGTVFTFREFADMLSADQPVYGLQQPVKIEDAEAFPHTIEGIAAKYIEEILANNPNGPYALSGHCLGGIIAFEMALQLKALGKTVRSLSLFDAVVPERQDGLRSSGSNYYNLPALTKQLFSTIFLKIKFEWFLVKNHPKQALLYKLNNAKSLSAFRNKEADMEMFNAISIRYKKAFETYRIKYYDDDMLVFYAMEHYYFVDKINDVVYKKISYTQDKWNAWKDHAKTVKLFEVDGEHSAMFDKKHANKLATILQKHLD